MEQLVNSLIGKTFSQASADMVLADAKENAEGEGEILDTDYMYALIQGMEPAKAKSMFQIDWASCWCVLIYMLSILIPQ